MKKAISLILTVIMLFGILPVSTYAEDLYTAKLTVESTDAIPGDIVEVGIRLADNPGIVSANLKVTFDEGLTLVDAVNGDVFPASITLIKPKQLENGGKITKECRFVWNGFDIADADIKDGTMITLRFELSEQAQIGDVLNIGVSTESGDVIDKNLNSVILNASGKVTVINFIPGDVNDDKKINMLDIVLLSRYIVDGGRCDPDGYAVTLNDNAANINDDGRVNMLDVVLLSRYIADGCITDPNGYNVRPVPPSKKCSHNLEATAEKEATCTDGGNIAYWYCSNCHKYFSDENGTVQIEQSATVVEKKGHTVVIDPAVPATYESTGLTEGSHCEVCKITIVPQDIIPKLESEQYAINYDTANGDTYLSSLEIENPNPLYYTSENGLTLKNPNVPGYRFLGWYDLPSGSNAEIVKKIPAGSKEEYTLYAHWEKIQYKVEFEFPTQFNADLVSVGDVTYTVDAEKVLPTPKLEGYIFAGWSDDEGNIIKSISPGTIGNKKYIANWLSKRNQAWSKQKLDDPIVIEDQNTNTILFTYEIGEIRNIPVFTIEDFGYINSNGISKTVTKTISTTVDKEMMKSYTSTVSNSTVNSFGWTLSDSWSNSTTINEEWCEQHGMTVEEAESYCKSDTNGWYVSRGSSGSSTTQTLDTKDTYDLNTSTSNRTDGGSSTNSDTHAAAVTDSSTTETSIEAELKVNSSFVEAGLKGSSTMSDTHSSTTSDSSTKSDSQNYSVSGGESDQGGSISHTGTNTTSNSSWNSESGYNGSSTVSSTESLSKAVSESISNRYGYGKTYINNSGETSSQGISSTESSSNSYGSAVTYSTEISQEESVSYTTTNTISGYHRWVMVDTAHVFAVVGYDIATSSYFVNTYSVMENNLKPFEDYSCSSGDYDDNQNSFIGFEVPYETITDYVLNRVGESEGLQVDADGVITEYNGSDDYVVIPEYRVIDNQDGTAKVVKVTGIDENAFRGNTRITGINMSTFITDIPDNAFNGCSSLVEIQSCTKSIGDNAFSGCTSMKTVSLGYGVDYIGDNAFDSVEEIIIYAANKNVVNAAVNSGAKKITVHVSDKCKSLDDQTYTLAKSTEEFTFNGYDRTYNNVFINSDAGKTVINRARFISTSATPLKISSPYVELNQVNVSSPGISLMLTADNCNLCLYGESNVESDSANAMLCKNVALSQLKNDYFSRLNVDGNVLICGDIENENYVSVTNGKITNITQEDYNKYEKGTFIVTFDANNGVTPQSSKTVYFGQPYGDMPIPTRENYTFAGWYTEAEDGTEITADTIVTVPTNQILYAKWTPNTFNLNYNANGGTVSPESKTLTFGDSLGVLATPIRDYHNFLGWYTAADGGELVDSSTVFSQANDITLYAHWELKEPSGWVKASSMPSDAQIVNTKWSYTLREYTTNSASSLSGWTKYDTKRTGWSSWSGWSTWNPDNGVRNVEWRSVYDHTQYHYYRWTNSNHSALYTYKTSSYNCTILEETWFDYQLPLSSKGSPIYYDGSDVYANRWVAANYAGNYSVDTTFTRDVNRSEWRYQDPVYTYYFYKDVSKESTSDPTGQSNVSNIVEWVQYREK